MRRRHPGPEETEEEQIEEEEEIKEVAALAQVQELRAQKRCQSAVMVQRFLNLMHIECVY